MDNVCRLCGLINLDLIPIFSLHNGRIVADLITILIPIKLKCDENIPSNVCQDCLKIIKTMHELRDKSIKSDIEYRNALTIESYVKKEAENMIIIPKILSVHQETEAWNEANPVNMEIENDDNFDNNDDSSNLSFPIILKKDDNSGDLLKCKFCDDTFRFQSNLAKHIKDNHKEVKVKLKYGAKPVNCTVCGILVTQATNLKRHMIQYHDSSLKFGCSQCSYKFATLNKLKHHGMKFHNIDNITPTKKENAKVKVDICECDHCGEKNYQKRRMLNHLLRKHFSGRSEDSLIYNCDYCTRTFSKKGNMFRHIQEIHSDELPFQCESCKVGFRTQRIFDTHMKNVHLIENKNFVPQTSDQVSVGAFICEFCSEDCTNSKYRYERHLVIMHDKEVKEVFDCETCKKRFVFRDSYNQHLMWHDRQNAEKLYKFDCNMCTRKFPNEERLERHKIQYHAVTASLVCHICGRTMRNKCSLNFHVKRHSEKREHACPQCPQSFVYVKELERHMNSHFDVRKYACTHEGCNKKFNDLYVFELHRKRHAGLVLRKHHCEHCEKKFTSKYALDRHILTHTQERPHKCEYCPMAYTQRNDLLKHLREHVGDSIYKCDFEGCTQGFRLKVELRQHYAVHYVK